MESEVLPPELKFTEEIIKFSALYATRRLARSCRKIYTVDIKSTPPYTFHIRLLLLLLSSSSS
jgi:hypothetical protein